jgi:tetratricopeptide (TPR) repeat protein
MSSIPGANGRPIHIFLSIAYKDRAFRKALEKHLSVLKWSKLIDDWHEYEIPPGSEWQRVAGERLNQADIILLCITPDFVASHYCYSVEVRQALEKHEAGTAHVIPVLFRPTFWQDLPFARLSGLPTSKREGVKPVTEWRNKDRAYVEIVAAIEKLIRQLSTANAHPQEDPPLLSTIPYRHNPFFTARTGVLQAIYATFAAPHNGSTTLQILSGLGGVGKTQIAIEYVHRYSADYRACFWLKGDSPEDLLADFTQLAHLLGLPEEKEPEQHIVIAAVKRYLQRAPRWLLIIDNLVNFELVDDIIPLHGEGDILITTQEQRVETLASQHTIENMSLEEGAFFLLQRARLLKKESGQDVQSLPATTLEQAREICTLVDGLPLALDQAGAYLLETKLPLPAYIERYKSQTAALLKQRRTPLTGHPASVATTFSLCLQKVQQRQSAAAEFLRICAFLQPDAIPLELFTRSAENADPEFQAITSNELDLQGILEVLLDLSLIQRNDDGNTINIQRLVQVVLKDEMEETAQRLRVERASIALYSLFPEPEFEVWSLCERYLPHVLGIANLLKQWNMQFYAGAQLLARAGAYLCERANYTGALALCEQALATLTHEPSTASGAEVAQVSQTLGTISLSQGNYARAQEYYEQALVIGERIWGSEGLPVARLLNYLGQVLQTQGRFAQAELYYKRALALHERVCGLEHPDAAMSLNNLGGIYDEQGDYTQAARFYEQAHTLRKRLLMPPHPELAIGYSNLARFYRVIGKYRQAEPLYQQAIVTFEAAFGPEHPRVATCLNNFGVFYIDTARYPQAEQLLDQALQIRILLFGREHPMTAGSWNNLARVYTKQGRYSEAHVFFERALSIREQKLGAEHPETLATLVNLGELLLAEQDLVNAETMLVQAEAQYRRTSGKHPDLARALRLRGQVYLARGTYEPAEQVLIEALAIYREHLGAAHPQTAIVMRWLGDLDAARGNDVRAALWYEQAITFALASMGGEHPEVVEILAQYQMLLQRMGEEAKIPSLLERVEKARLSEQDSAPPYTQ